MSWLSTPRGRRALFFALYLSEGAPIGYLWLALPTRLRAEGVPLTDITALTSLLVLPWTFKFVGAPLIDGLRTRRIGRRHYVVAAQMIMAATILSTLWLDPVRDLPLLTGVLLAHACAAATQDVAIDALCIATTEPSERGGLNGWMQAGMLVGRAAMGGGALILERYVGGRNVVVLLVILISFSLVLVVTVAEEPPPAGRRVGARVRLLLTEARAALGARSTWLGLFVALVGGAAFKAFDVVYGPYLIDRGYESDEVGWFSAGPMVACTMVGALVGGAAVDRFGRGRMVVATLVAVDLVLLSIAVVDASLADGEGAPALLGLLGAMGLCIGAYLSASYAMFMDLTRPAVAAMQFSLFMGATNGCESWSVRALGTMVEQSSYATALLALVIVSMTALPALYLLRRDVGHGPLDER